MGIGTKRQHSSEDSADEIDKLPSVPRRSIPAVGDTTAPRGRRSARGLRRTYSRESSERSDGRLSRKAAATNRSRRHDPQSPQRTNQQSRRPERMARRKPFLETVHSDDDENDDDADNDHSRRDDDPASPPYYGHSLRRILPSPNRRHQLNSRRSRRSAYDEDAQQSDRMSDSQSPDSPKKRTSSRLQSNAGPRGSARLARGKKGNGRNLGRTAKRNVGLNDEDEDDNDEDNFDEDGEDNEADGDDGNGDGNGDDDDDDESEDEDEDADDDDGPKKGNGDTKRGRRSTRSFPAQVKKFKQTKSVHAKPASKSKGRKSPVGRIREEKQVTKTRKYRRLTRGTAPSDNESTPDADAQSTGSKQRSASNDNDDMEENVPSRKKGNGSDGDDQDEDADDDDDDVNDDESNENAPSLSERDSDDDRDDDRDDDDRMIDSERSDASGEGERFNQPRQRRLPLSATELTGSKGSAPKTRGSTISEQVSDEDVESWQQDSSKKSNERLTSRQRALQGEAVELEYTKLESPKVKKKQLNEEYDQDDEMELKKQQKARLRQMISEKRNKEKRAAMVDRVLRGVTSKRKKTTMASEAHVAEVGTRLTTNEAREGCLRFTSNREGTTVSLPEDATAPIHLLVSGKAQYPPACTRDPKTGKRIFASTV